MVSINADPLFESFVEADFELKEDLEGDSCEVILEDHYCNAVWEEVAKGKILMGN